MAETSKSLVPNFLFCIAPPHDASEALSAHPVPGEHTPPDGEQHRAASEAPQSATSSQEASKDEEAPAHKCVDGSSRVVRRSGDAVRQKYAATFASARDHLENVMSFRAVIIAGTLLLAHSPAVDAEDIFVLAAFDRAPDTAAFEWMQQETARVFSDAGLTFSWRPGNQLNIVPLSTRRVTLQVHGDCRIEPSVVPTAENGPMGWIDSQDGELRPFIDLDCDRISAMVWQNRGTLPLPLVVRAFGLAMGRVLAHEVYHYITQSTAHRASDIFRHSMTSRDLMLPDVRFEPAEIEALRKAMSTPWELSGTE
jgi:hypothetical protein